MGAETDDEIKPGVYLGNYGRLFVLIWRNGVGKLGFMAYPSLEHDYTTFGQINIQIIWVIYYVQVIFQLVFGLNFIIAILEQRYKEIEPLKDEYIYRNKASLNEECYSLLKQFFTPDPIKSLVFSYRLPDLISGGMLHGNEEAEFNNFTNHIKDMYSQYFEQYEAKQDLLMKVLEKYEKKCESQREMLKEQCNDYETKLVHLKENLNNEVDKYTNANYVKFTRQWTLKGL